MKNLRAKASFFITTMLIAVMLLSSCGGSTKGKWSDEDKAKFKSELDKVDLSSLGKNKEKFLDCYFEKVQAKYANFTEADADAAGCEALAKECADEVLKGSSKKGNWSDEDKETFKAEMAQADLSYLGDAQEEFLACYLSKLEANYESFFDANSDPDGCTAIAEECAPVVEEETEEVVE